VCVTVCARSLSLYLAKTRAFSLNLLEQVVAVEICFVVVAKRSNQKTFVARATVANVTTCTRKQSLHHSTTTTTSTSTTSTPPHAAQRNAAHQQLATWSRDGCLVDARPEHKAVRETRVGASNGVRAHTHVRIEGANVFAFVAPLDVAMQTFAQKFHCHAIQMLHVRHGRFGRLEEQRRGLRRRQQYVALARRSWFDGWRNQQQKAI
jgi:hypothetical protein